MNTDAISAGMQEILKKQYKLVKDFYRPEYFNRLLKPGLARDYEASFDKTPTTKEKENKEMHILYDTEKICIDSMIKNNETLGTMVLVIGWSRFDDCNDSIERYIAVKQVREAIQEYIETKE